MRPSLIAAVGLSACLCLSASRCSGAQAADRGGELRVLAYNVHNLFDGVDDGGEYPEFSVSGGLWSEARYRARLAAVGKAVAAALPDGDWPELVCLEEVENHRVLEDLAAGPLKAAGYRHLAMAPAEGSAVNCGLLSKLPIRSVRAHALASTSRPGRSLLEARVALPGAGERSLVLFALHWKSKVEGAEKTEGERREAAALLAGLVGRLLAAEPAAEVLACGDFNESPDEYLRAGRRYPTALLPLEAAATAPPARRLLVTTEPGEAGLRGGEPVLFSPWAADSGYSYSYKGGRERIDGFLLSAGLVDGEGLAFRGFGVVDAPFLLGPGGEPATWSASSGSGYSDHLPILLVLEGLGR